jgi:PST family polysaccharide transporter
MTLKQKVLTGVKWTALANVSGQVMNLVSTVILARLLTPDDFGIFANLMIFVGFLGMFVGMGTSAAIVHMDKPSDTMLSSIFYFNIFSGTLFCLLLIAASGPISLFFENPEIEYLLQWLSLTFIAGSFTGVQGALFTKKLDFKTPTIIGITNTFISLTAGIVAASFGLGVWSLIIRSLTGALVSTIMFWKLSSWKPRLAFSFNELKKVFHFTSNLTGFTFINYFARNADNFLIGKFIGSSSLGVYNMAYNIMLYPLQNISNTIIRVLFPAFSQVKDDNEKLKKGYLRVIFFIALISFPIMVGLMATAQVFVSVVFGDKWENLASIVLILAPLGMMQSIVTTTGSLYMTKGTVNALFKIGTLNAVITVCGFIVGLPFGVEGVAWGYVLANVIMLYPNLLISWRQIELSVLEGLSEILPLFVISIIMGISVMLIGIFLETVIINQVLQLFIMVVSGIVIYLVLLRIKYGNLLDLVNELRGR